MTRSKDRGERDATIERVMEGYEAFMHRLALSHAPEFAEVGLTMSQAKILYLVQSAGALRMSELASRLGVTISTTSVQVERLAVLGLVTRRDDPADRRHVLLELTRDGADRLERMRELNAAHMRRMLHQIPTPDLDIVEHSLRILGRAVDAAAVLPPPAPGSERKERA